MQVMYGASAASLTMKATGDSRIFTEDPGRVWCNPGECMHHR
jgi:hypothetical protein